MMQQISPSRKANAIPSVNERLFLVLDRRKRPREALPHPSASSSSGPAFSSVPDNEGHVGHDDHDKVAGTSSSVEYVRIRWDPREMGPPPTETLRRLLREAMDRPDGSKGLVFRRLETNGRVPGAAGNRDGDHVQHQQQGHEPTLAVRHRDPSSSTAIHHDSDLQETTPNRPQTPRAESQPQSEIPTTTTLHLQKLACRDSVVVLDCSTAATSAAGNASSSRVPRSPALTPAAPPKQAAASTTPGEGSSAKRIEDKGPVLSPSPVRPCVSHFAGKDVYVLDEAASRQATAQAVEQAMAGLQLSSSRPGVGDSSGFKVPPALACRPSKREREEQVANWSGIPEYFLRPVLRQETAVAATMDGAVMRSTMVDSLEEARQRLVASAYSYWEQVSGDIVEEALTELGMAYAAQFDLPPETEEEARDTYLRGIYCYPDHRQDDEYDSNAEDFEGNEYPDEKSSESRSESDLPLRMANDEEEGEEDDIAWFGVEDETEEEDEEEGEKAYRLGRGGADCGGWSDRAALYDYQGRRAHRGIAFDGWNDKDGYDDNEYEDVVWGNENDDDDDW